MTGICGWFPSHSEEKSNDVVLGKMARGLELSVTNGTRGNSYISNGCLTMGVLRHYETSHDRSLEIFAYGNLDIKCSEYTGCIHSPKIPKNNILSDMYRRYGTNLLDKLAGSFAIAVVDREKNIILLAIDRFGIESLCFCITGNNQIVFGTTVDALTGHPLVQNNISFQAVYDYTYFHIIPSPNTIFNNIKKLEPAHYLLYTKGKTEINSYWTPNFNNYATDSLCILKNSLYKELNSAVSNFYVNKKTGAFLSGGLDSSTIAGLLSKNSNLPLPVFSIGFSEAGYDEMNYARLAARHFGLEHHEYYVTPDDVVDALPKVANSYDEPFGNSSAIPTFFCAWLAKYNNINIMLAGDGGDELFAGNERYAKQQLFSLYSNLPLWLRNFFLEPYLLNNKTLRHIRLINKIARYIEHSKIEMPDRLQNYNLLHMMSPASMFEPDFYNTIDKEHPIKHLRKIYNKAPTDSLVNKMLYLDWKITLADNDLRKVNKMCQANDVQVHYPMLNNNVVDLSIRIPPQLKMKGQKLRYFYKQAFKDFLPNEIINKPKHGFGLPFGEWLKTSPKLQEMIYSNLSDLKKRDIFQESFINNLIQKHRSEHAAYYGTMVWVLAMLEEWFKYHYSK